MSFLLTVKHFFDEGGWTMYITATAGFIGLAIAIERGRYLFFESKLDSTGFMGRIKDYLVQNRLQDAVHYCQINDKAPLPAVIKSGVERVGCDEQLVRQSMESVYLEQVPKVTDRLSYISLIANAGLLFGLLGTVLGLIRQFGALAAADAADKQLMMAKGIAEAMNNTALGLMVALPALIIHGIYSARASKILESMERCSAQFLDWVGLYNYGELNERISGNAVKNQNNVTQINDKKAA